MMRVMMRCLCRTFILLPLVALCSSKQASDHSSLVSRQQRPTLYLFGDSTMATCRYDYLAKGTSGWGTSLAAYLDGITVVNLARSGYSSRQAAREHIYAQALREAKRGDYLIVQWGRNDGRLSGVGKDKVVCETAKCPGTSSAEPVVYAFETYLADVAAQFQAKGVHVIIASLATQNPYFNGHYQTSQKDDEFIRGAQRAAQKTGATYVNMHAKMTSLFRHLDAEQVDRYYFGGGAHASSSSPPSPHDDITHFTPLGSLVAAKRFLSGLHETGSSLSRHVRPSPGTFLQPHCPA